eukprot:COSAG05_NODE_757_length_7492_cov_8.402543_7_plen_106_part_00
MPSTVLPDRICRIWAPRPAAAGRAARRAAAPRPSATLLLMALLLALTAGAATGAIAWDPSIEAYRQMLVEFSGTHAAGVRSLSILNEAKKLKNFPRGPFKMRDEL